MPTKREMLDQLRSGKVAISPLSFRFLEGRLEAGRNCRLDALVEASWREGIGGGFGIYLKTDHVLRMEVRTLFRQWPEPRSTNDLDLFLRPELLIEPATSAAGRS